MDRYLSHLSSINYHPHQLGMIHYIYNMMMMIMMIDSWMVDQIQLSIVMICDVLSFL